MAQATVTVKVKGVPLEVDYTYIPCRRGDRDRYGVPLTPDDPADVQIEEVRCEGWEILCFMDDDSYLKIKKEILEGRAELVSTANTHGLKSKQMEAA
jgi:hypothetical protein